LGDTARQLKAVAETGPRYIAEVKALWDFTTTKRN
jgi:hypothetical protein